MDLKDVVKDVRINAREAYDAFHAGHHDTAEKYLYEIEKQVVEYLRVPATPAGDVTQATDTSSQEDKLQATPAQVPDAEISRPGVVPFQDQTKPLPASQFQKPTQ